MIILPPPLRSAWRFAWSVPMASWKRAWEVAKSLTNEASEALFHDAIGTDQANLHAFRSGGGKMIMYHGLFDQLIFPRGSYDYYNRAAEKMKGSGPKPTSAAGGMAALQEFYRFFPYPNNAHCGGGTGPQIDTNVLFDALVNWVEHGIAPDYVLATQNPGGGVCRTRKIVK